MLLLTSPENNSQSLVHSAALNRRRGHQKGISVFVFGFCLASIVPVIGLAVDLSMMYMAQTRLSSAADSAVLAAARGLSRGSDDTNQTATAVSTAAAYMLKNFPTGVFQTSGLTYNTTVDTSTANVRIVNTTASASIPMMFMRYVGPTNMTIRASAQATRRDTNVIMILDRSGSMAASSSCTPMKAAAQSFTGMFAPGRDNVGLVTFSTDVQLNNAASTSFTSVNTNIANITCVGSTNTTQALWTGYKELIRLNQPNALNVLLLFTDGQPTVTPINVQFRSSGLNGSNCPAALRGNWYPAVIGGYTNPNSAPLGMYNPNATSIDQIFTVAGGTSGCSFSAPTWPANVGNIANDIQTVATADIYGNSVNVPSGVTGYTAVPANPAINWTNMINVATNTSYEAARHIRKGDPVSPAVTTAQGGTSTGIGGVFIYTIGLGTAAYPADIGFLKDLANDLYSQNISRNGSPQNSGIFVDAPTIADLNPAFQRVASEILRLSR